MCTKKPEPPNAGLVFMQLSYRAINNGIVSTSSVMMPRAQRGHAEPSEDVRKPLKDTPALVF